MGYNGEAPDGDLGWEPPDVYDGTSGERLGPNSVEPARFDSTQGGDRQHQVGIASQEREGPTGHVRGDATVGCEVNVDQRGGHGGRAWSDGRSQRQRFMFVDIRNTGVMGSFMGDEMACAEFPEGWSWAMARG